MRCRELDGFRPNVVALSTARTPGAVVRVDLEFSGQSGVSRHLAVYFDGGAMPEGCTA